MLKMKLLTLACALGILACGACFLPPSQRNSNPSLPPTQIDLKGIRTIGVRVTNNSEWRHIDASALAHAIEVGINGYTKETGAKAFALTATGQEDATIEIAIQSENAILEAKPAPPGTSRWSYKVTISATLTKHDGTVVWQETNLPYRSRPVSAANPVDVWNKPFFGDWVRYGIGSNLVFHMFNGH